jgi:preprotein translocase subunit SecE
MRKATAEKQTNPLVRYLRETRGELRKVTWPTREESGRLTAVVLAVTLAFAIFLWIFDYIFSNGFRLMLDLLLGL